MATLEQRGGTESDEEKRRGGIEETTACFKAQKQEKTLRHSQKKMGVLGRKEFKVENNQKGKIIKFVHASMSPIVQAGILMAPIS